jgi:phosphatidylserine decarboxylase
MRAACVGLPVPVRVASGSCLRTLIRCQEFLTVKEGYYFGLPLLLFGGVAYLAQWTVVAIVLVLLALFVFSFFRDPERVIPSESGAIVSPGDGRVVVVTDEEDSGVPGKRISIFLAVWNVHVNRAPAAGVITKMEYRPGKFLAAMRARASVENEQNVFTLSTDAGDIVFKQIAGLIARRVVSWKKQGERVARGERIGLVRFGSRVDVWVPKDAEILVKLGQNVKGGSSVLARWQAKEVSSHLGDQQLSDADATASTVGKHH